MCYSACSDAAQHVGAQLQARCSLLGNIGRRWQVDPGRQLGSGEEIDELVVGPFRVVEAKLIIRCTLATQQIAWRDTHGLDELDQISRKVCCGA